MILEQIYLACLSQASYLIGDPKTGTCALVDPRRDIDDYLNRAGELGMEIRYVLLTHFHADFVSGQLELQKATGATIYLGANAQAEYEFTPLQDGDTIEFGDVRLTALTTPGHTPESICIVVHDLAADTDSPHAVCTGDTLFIGDVGRPDLMASAGITAEELAAQMYHSLRNKLLTLPDATLVYPGHGAGSACGKNLSTDTVSTIGQQRTSNYALQPMSEQEFVRMLTENQPTAPGYFALNANLNRQLHQTLQDSSTAALRPLDFDALRHAQQDGAQVLDVRHADAFAASHLLGSINIGLGGRFASWCGSLLSTSQPIVLITEPGQEAEAVMRLGRIGFDHVQGYLQGGMASVPADQQQTTGRVGVAEMAAQLDGSDRPFLLDVRTPTEWADGAVAGATHIPLIELSQRLEEVPEDQSVLVYCAGGYRSSAALSLIAPRNANIADLRGGYSAWQQEHTPA